MRYFSDFYGDIRLLISSSGEIYYINFCYTNPLVFQFILKFPILPFKVTDPNIKIDKLKSKNIITLFNRVEENQQYGN